MSGAMRECNLCRRLISSAGRRICQDCFKYLEDIYPTVRTFIRDSKNPKLDVSEIADALEISIKYVQGLVDYGYLNRELPNAKPSESNDDSNREKLAKELQKATIELKEQAARRQSRTTYGQDRYTTGKK